MTNTNAPLIAGLCLTTTVLLAALYGITPEFVPKLLVSAPAWVAAVLLWTRATHRTRIQAYVLSTIGVAGLAWGATHAGRIDPTLIFASNILLVAMLAAVSFLRLTVRPGFVPAMLAPRGRNALWSTLLGVHLFGAVINLSAVFIMGDRLSSTRELTPRQISVLTRGFSAAAFWSPFFAAMAAALTYAPGAQVSQLMLLGIPLATLALIVTATRKSAADRDFEGYPMRFATLWLPATLAALVLLLHEAFPHWPILTIICMLAPLVSVAYLTVTKHETYAALGSHLRLGLPSMANELLLFLAAGLMAAGIDSTLSTLHNWLPFSHFGGIEAALTLFFMYLIALVGVHPVIAIAVIGTVFAPLHPQANLLAMTFLCSWAIAVGTSPFSGMNLAIQGRYRVAPLDFLRWNGRYSIVMLAASMVTLFTYGHWFT
ncbi:hypothetical protein [Acidihalobacter ferrooxydans]|uniref:hypothetical protein n=1 Tax=Acidihalobacter ferrooxydans TaxID=1765967 RepID=UPI0009F85433|nr:hypothetical protein [Acidihalobacter ferrooxydans]